MAVGNDVLPPLAPVDGIRLAALEAGVRKPGRRDLALIEIAEDSACAAVFTSNRFRAAPVRVAERHLSAGTGVRYLLINTGNANAGTGERGDRDARQCCEALATLADCRPEQVLPFSTGVIGEPLRVERILERLPALVAALSADGWANAAAGILTTDTRPKGASRHLTLDGRRVTLTGIAKGSGMIRPDMATMLAYVGTDVAIEPGLARRLLREAVAVSFNRITVDGDTSTNDACVFVATGHAGVRIDSRADPHCEELLEALTGLCTELAKAIVRDGEGATRFVSVAVAGAANATEADAVAFTVAESPLVKTAIHAADPNWGRILAAVGRAGVRDLDVDRVSVRLDDYVIAEAGCVAPGYVEEEAARRLSGEDVTIGIDLGRGTATTTVWTCDLSAEYIRINAEYRS